MSIVYRKINLPNIYENKHNMNKQTVRFMIILLLNIFIMDFSSANNDVISIIPEPVSVEKKNGTFSLPNNISIYFSESKDVEQIAMFLKSKLAVATGKKVYFSNQSQKSATIILKLYSTENPIIGKEGYLLSVSKKNITISANQPVGLFYGAQSLIQLFPPEIEKSDNLQQKQWTISCIEILDYPRFGWRGLMLDASRHFFTVEETKRYIDNMSRYKFNIFHWHLTDDDGWRIEIKSYPKLTEIGAWRVKREGNYNTFTPPLPSEARDYGGYYSQEEVKEIVKYAKQRFIEIVPEIDVPGHSLAAVASYPELSCTEGAENYVVRSGEAILDWSGGGRPVALVDNTLCPANEKVYEFMEKVISEVSALFPFEYFHIGGDEAPYNFWEKSAQVQKLMKQENLKNMAEVQSYFNKRVEKMVNANGKKMIGWDEILEGGINPSTAVMCWRDEKYAVDATQAKHYVVMSPNKYAYLDYMQGDISTEAPIFRSLRLNQVYKFEPVPNGADASYVLGGQGNLWTEQIFNYRQAEYMTWPRGFAIAESLWSQPDRKNWNQFVGKTENHLERLDYNEIKYSPAMYDPIVNIRHKNGKHWLTLTSEIDDLDIYISFDSSAPDKYYPKYTEPMPIPIDVQFVKIITYRAGKVIGRQLTVPMEKYRK